MLYICVLTYLAIVYIRPGEIIPGWIGFPFLNVASIVCAVAAAFSLVLRPRAFWKHPLDWFVLLFSLAVVLSNPANGWLGGAWFAIQRFAPVVFCYFLIRVGVENDRQFRGVVVLIVALTLFQAVNGIVQYYGGMGVGNVTAYVERPGDGSDPDSDAPDLRIRGTGIFNDPNDLALTLVIAVPFLLSGALGRGRSMPLRMLSVGALAPLITALFLTLSRGGMLAFAAVCGHFANRRWGRSAAIAVLVLALIGAAALSTRLGNLSAADDSAQGRVQSWAEGLEMFKTHSVLGVGYGQYTDYNEIVAHNSFVHSLGDLGIVGGVAFMGLFYCFFRTTRSSTAELSNNVRASGIGLLTALMFLSRQYDVIPYVVLALGASLPSQTASPLPDSQQADAEQPGTAMAFLDVARVAVLTVAAIGSVYVLVRLFAVWGK